MVLVVVVLCLVGLPLLASFANDRARPWRRVQIAGLGLAHGFGHMALSILAVAFAPVWTVPVWAAGYLVVWGVGRAMARSSGAAVIIPLWLSWLALPVVVAALAPTVRSLDGWLFLAVCVVASAASCAILGSYLWTASLRGGHFNESGGAARLERHRQLLRFRVRRDQLDVYVLRFARHSGAGSRRADRRRSPRRSLHAEAPRAAVWARVSETARSPADRRRRLVPFPRLRLSDSCARPPVARSRREAEAAAKRLRTIRYDRRLTHREPTTSAPLLLLLDGLHLVHPSGCRPQPAGRLRMESPGGTSATDTVTSYPDWHADLQRPNRIVGDLRRMP